jgi:quercetin dioxygenase-like cupin family protein
VERFSFDADVAFTPRDELLERSPFQAAVFRFAPGGRIARHPAGSRPQILAVLERSGEVSGASGVDEPIEAGEAVFWREGEEHEVKTTGGLTALRSRSFSAIWLGRRRDSASPCLSDAPF